VEFAQKLAALMKERGWTQYRLAKRMDCSQSTVAHWLAGDTKPQRATMKRLCEELDVEPSYFTEPDVIILPVSATSLQSLKNDERVLLEHYRSMTENDRDMMRDLARRLTNAD